MDREKLVLVDGHSILNRAFYGMPDLTNAAGVHTGAVYGFLNILFKILDEEKADYLTVAFDVHAPTFRHETYAEYKGTRKPMPEELREQVPLVKKVLQAMGVRTAAEGVKGYYPSFDITPPHLVSGVATDKGIYSPYDLARYFDGMSMAEMKELMV